MDDRNALLQHVRFLARRIAAIPPYLVHQNLLLSQHLEQERRRMALINAGSSGTSPTLGTIRGFLFSYNIEQLRSNLPTGIDAVINRCTLQYESTAADLKELCIICYELYKLGEELRILPCLHKYHLLCVEEWFKKSFNCPICRRDIQSNENKSGRVQSELYVFPTRRMNLAQAGSSHVVQVNFSNGNLPSVADTSSENLEALNNPIEEAVADVNTSNQDINDFEDNISNEEELPDIVETIDSLPSQVLNTNQIQGTLCQLESASSSVINHMSASRDSGTVDVHTEDPVNSSVVINQRLVAAEQQSETDQQEQPVSQEYALNSGVATSSRNTPHNSSAFGDFRNPILNSSTTYDSAMGSAGITSFQPYGGREFLNPFPFTPENIWDDDFEPFAQRNLSPLYDEHMSRRVFQTSVAQYTPLHQNILPTEATSESHTNYPGNTIVPTQGSSTFSYLQSGSNINSEYNVVDSSSYYNQRSTSPTYSFIDEISSEEIERFEAGLPPLTTKRQPELQDTMVQSTRPTSVPSVTAARRRSTISPLSQSVIVSNTQNTLNMRHACASNSMSRNVAASHSTSQGEVSSNRCNRATHVGLTRNYSSRNVQGLHRMDHNLSTNYLVPIQINSDTEEDSDVEYVCTQHLDEQPAVKRQKK